VGIAEKVLRRAACISYPPPARAVAKQKKNYDAVRHSDARFARSARRCACVCAQRITAAHRQLNQCESSGVAHANLMRCIGLSSGVTSASLPKYSRITSASRSCCSRRVRIRRSLRVCAARALTLRIRFEVCPSLCALCGFAPRCGAQPSPPVVPTSALRNEYGFALLIINQGAQSLCSM